MNYKKLFLIFPVLVTVLLLIITGCNSKEEINSPQNSNFDSPQYVLIDNTDLENGIDVASLDKEMDFSASLFDYSFIKTSSAFGVGNIALKGNGWFDKFDFGKHLGRIFKQLNLSDDQKASVKGFMQEYHAAVKQLAQKFREANKSIVDSANIKRKAVMEELKSGAITKEQAKVRINRINEVTKTLIQNNPASLRIKEAMCTERTNLLGKIAGILTAEQLTKWDEFISKIKSPC